jgi:hypothetical protein
LITGRSRSCGCIKRETASDWGRANRKRARA